MSRLAWHAAAACSGLDPDIFFPKRSSQVEDALRICGGCWVRAQCLAQAMATEDYHRHGVWGGLTADERHDLAQQTADTAAAYQQTGHLR
ncbi:WhiB family transcriptional regulator [Streptomyces sp. NPDC006798]|uniref:WhiB family transcriptional regulator n=1 Tax=Streptomyces sp. NPDC006798 TaxID=3155462 RepID=UPI0033D32636